MSKRTASSALRNSSIIARPSAFLEAGDVFDPATAARLRKWVYSSGNSVEPGEAYRQFKGRDATVEPMMRNKGLLEVASAA